MKLNDLKKKNLPDNPGVYLFKKGKEILYIGKATSLKDRTRSYFAGDLIKTRGPAIVDMVTLADKIDYEETESVLEALLLESKLIKKHQPKYNVKEKDDKSYNSVLITDENYPRIFVMRNRELEQRKELANTGKVKIKIKNPRSNLSQNAELKNGLVNIRKIYGPFPSSGQLNQALKIIRKIFPFYDDKKVSKLNIQIGLIPDPDVISKTEYKKNIRNIELFFQGKKKKIISELNKEIKKCIEKQNFEKAEKIKKQIFSLQHINDVSLISDTNFTNQNSFRIESYDIAHMAGKNTVGVMTVMEDGDFNKNEYRKFIIKEARSGDDYGALAEVLRRRFNHEEWTLPKLIVIDGGKAQLNTTNKVMNEFGYKIPLVSVVKDEFHRAKEILGENKYKNEYAQDILKINAETHRFAINFHRSKRRKNMI